MPITEEKSHLLNLQDSGIETFADGYAVNDRIQEWFGTPAGTVADDPAWGHNLLAYKFEPPGNILNSMCEMSILNKIQRDIPGILIRSLVCEFKEIDLFLVKIDFGIQKYTAEVSI